jgi:ssDNA-binding replication factor A large subunit
MAPRKQPTHTIINLKPLEKNIELKVVVLEKQGATQQTRNQTKITRFLVADHTASIFISIYDDLGDILLPGDVLYINGAYTSMFQNEMILYESKQGKIHKIDEFFFLFNEKPNVSQGDWQKEA